MILDLNNIEICVINLPNRTERLERTKNEIAKFWGENKNINIIPGVVMQHSYQGIATAHMNAIQYAKDKGLEQICILEDDVWFQSEKSKEYADNCFNNVPDDYNILLGGIYSGTTNVSDNVYWNIPKNYCALHFYIVRNTVYDKLLSFQKNSHIDRWIAINIEKVYVSKEFFAIQYDGFSDNVKQQTNYNSTRLKSYPVLK